MDPALPFNSDFVTFEYETYVTATGDYFNESVPFGAIVDLKCFYTPSMIIEKYQI